MLQNASRIKQLNDTRWELSPETVKEIGCLHMCLSAVCTRLHLHVQYAQKFMTLLNWWTVPPLITPLSDFLKIILSNISSIGGGTSFFFYSSLLHSYPLISQIFLPLNDMTLLFICLLQRFLFSMSSAFSEPRSIFQLILSCLLLLPCFCMMNGRDRQNCGA